jgi:hypothetical protein
MPASYMDSSESGDEEEQHFAHYAQACNQMEFVGPFTRTIVQTAKPEQARADYLGLSAPTSFSQKAYAVFGATSQAISEQLLFSSD